ncbi:MAG TPA: hypothetical protein VF131_21205 [Blastocatellia bacterium]|nr:hypothetical protein [Blastocatellia bacterium]
MSLKQAKNKFVLLATVAFLVFLSHSSNSFAAQKQAKQKKPVVAKAGQVIELRRIDQLKEEFQRDAGKVRFVTILSPT